MTNATPPPGQSKATARDAIIFVSGLGHEWSDQSIDGFAKRIATAFDVSAATPGAQFRVLSGREEAYGSGLKTNLRTISRRDGDKEVPILDLYEMDYIPALTRRYEAHNQLIKSVLLAAALISGLFRFLPALSKKRASKTLREKLQIMYGMLILGLLSVYTVILFFAVAGTIQGTSGRAPALKESPANGSLAAKKASPGGQALSTAAQGNRMPGASAAGGAGQAGLAQETPANAQNGPKAPGTIPSSRSEGWLQQLMQWFQRNAATTVILLAALGVFTTEVKGKLVKAAVEYLCTLYYLNLGERRSAILGQLTALLEHIGEKSDTPYRNIHLFSFSFGSIVAIDALFPTSREPTRRFQSIETLVTIGCPFDLVRTFWPAYFDDRCALPATPNTWINVFSPVDVLSSNFRDDDAIADAGRTFEAKSAAQPPLPLNIPYIEAANPKNLSILDWLTLIGLRAHSMYWGKEYEAESNCFTQVIAKIYGKDPALA